MPFYDISYKTNYNDDERTYSHNVFAVDNNHLDTIIASRPKMREYYYDILSFKKERTFPTASSYFIERKYASTLHALTYIMMIGSTHDDIDLFKFMNDMGAFHEFVHYMHFGDTSDDCLPRKELLVRILDLELSIPGYLSTAEKEKTRKMINKPPNI